MKVLHLLQSNRFSGAENVVCQIMGMFENESDIEMVYCSRDGEIRSVLEGKNITFCPIERLSVSEVKRVIEAENPDIIHAHDMRASFVAALSCGKAKLISHIHNSDFQARRFSVKSMAFLIALCKVDSVIWVSKSCFESYIFHGFCRRKSEILSNVIDAQQILEKATEDEKKYDYDIVYVGRLANPKNPIRLIKIISIIKVCKEDVKVGIVGTGDLAEDTEKYAEKLGVNENVIFHGFMKNPLKILKDSKVMVMTSDREGLPMVALEAMALGIPIVSTPTDGMCDIVKGGETGYLEEDEQEFAYKVLELLEDEDKREAFSRATLREFLRINDINHYKRELKDMYGR